MRAGEKVATRASSLRPSPPPLGGRPTAPIVRCIGPGLDRGTWRPAPVPCPCPRPEESVPDIRPFRALRFDPEVVGDLGPVVAPPYDVIGPDLERSLLARSPHNAVRLDLPHGGAGRGPRRAVPARRPHVRGVALRWHAAQGPAGRLLRLRAGLPRPGHRDRADAARLLRSPAPRAVRTRRRRAAPRAHAGRAARGPLPAPARDRREHLAGRRALPRPVGRGRGRARRRGGDATHRRRDRRRRRPPSAVDARRRRPGRRRRAPDRGRPRRARSTSPTATTGTRRRCATATSGA